MNSAGDFILGAALVAGAYGLAAWAFNRRMTGIDRLAEPQPVIITWFDR